MSTEQTNEPPTREQLEEEIERLRSDLGETVEALTHKLDVKTRAKEKVRAVPPAVPIAAGVAVVAALGVWLWRRRS